MKKHFPIFLNIENKQVLVVGGGKIAQRRIRALYPFSFSVEVVSREVSPSFQEELKQRKIPFSLRPFQKTDLKDKEIVLICTNDKEINEEIALEARKENILVNRCDIAEKSDFWFSAMEMNDDITFAMISEEKNHKLIKSLREKIRSLLDKGDFQ